jgi:hypothetical protein
VDEREDPRAGLAALGPVDGSRAPDGEEGLLHGVLGECSVAQDAEGEPVGDAAETVVQLAERAVLAPGGERDQRLVGEVREVARHPIRLLARTDGPRYHGRRTVHRRLFAPVTAIGSTARTGWHVPTNARRHGRP